MNSTKSIKTKILEKWGGWAVTHWGGALLIGLGITIITCIGFGFLQMEMTFYSILPRGSKQVENLKSIIENFPLSSAITVVVEAKDKTDKEQAKNAIKKSIDSIVREFEKSEYSEYISDITGKMDIDFFRKYGLITQKVSDLKRLKNIYGNLDLVPLLTRLNDDFETEYSGNEEKLQEDEQMAISQFKGLEKLLNMILRSLEGESINDDELNANLEYLLYGEQYFFSKDDTLGLLIIQPTFDVNNLEMLTNAVPLMEKVAKEIAYRNGTIAGLTGLTVVGKDEMVTSEQGLALSMAVAFLLIIVIMIIAFRMFSVPFISGLPLIMGIVWTVGITGLVLQRLNIMTAMYMVALIGLGIDYAIHLLTTYVQEKDDGKNTSDAMVASFTKSGSGILTGALTSAIAFLVLISAKSEMVKELGFVAGMGILCEYISMMLFIPALIGMRHSLRVKRGKDDSGHLLKKLSGQSRTLPGIGKLVGRFPIVVVIVFTLLAALCISQVPGLSVQDNIMEMEAKGLESVELQDRMVKEFEMAPDCLYVRTKNLDEVKRLTNQLEKLASVKMVDSLAPYVVTGSEKAIRLPVIGGFKQLLTNNTPGNFINSGPLADELDRLFMNFSELSLLAYSGGMQRMSHTLDDLVGMNEKGEKVADSVIDTIIKVLSEKPESIKYLVDFQKRFVPLIKGKFLVMTENTDITLDDLPGTVKNSYISKQGDDFLISIYPTQNPWIRQYRELFKAQVASVTDDATGMILAADQMTQIAEVDTVNASILAFLFILVLLFIDFKNIKLSIITMLPLTCSLFCLFGIMALTNIKFDFVNIICIPLVIGIGIDDAVHISHRYLYEGKGKINIVIMKTGAAVFLTSLTTMIGFASFIPSVMRAMKSTGIVLTIAIALAFVFSVFFHSSLLVIVNEKLKLNIRPWDFGKKKAGTAE